MSQVAPVPANPVQDLLDSHVLWVTGKGGTGKTTYSAALAILGAAKGRKTLLCEVDTSRPAMGTIFDTVAQFEPEQVLPNLDLANVHWDGALAAYVQRYIPVRRLVKRILDNRMVRRFLDFAPGARELFILSRLVHLAEDYDLVVVDMHASGHAYSMLDITRSAVGLFKSGPMLQRANEIIEVLNAQTTRTVFVSLAEEMVVNETLETRQNMVDANLVGGEPVVFLNRATMPSLSDEERALIAKLDTLDLPRDAREFVRAGVWEDRLEQATSESMDRLTEGFGHAPVLVPPSGAGGNPRNVVAKVAAHLGRRIGITRRDLPWT